MRVCKLASIVALICVSVALCIIARTPPAPGYEVSIYEAYPVYFWLLLAASICCGIGIVVHQAFTEAQGRWWIAGLCLVIFSNSILLLLSEFRGYFFYGRGDTATHLGYIRDILTTGQIGASNFYPIQHILGTDLIEIAGLSTETIPSLLFVLFSGTYILNICLLSRVVAKSHGQRLLMVAFAMPLIYSMYHASIHPNMLALFMVPCLLYLYHMREGTSGNCFRYVLLLLLMAFSITFFHPVTALFVTIIILIFGLPHVAYSLRNFSRRLQARLLRRRMPRFEQYNGLGRNFGGISLIMLVTFFAWYISYSSIRENLGRTADWLLHQMGTPLVEAEIGLVREAGLSLAQLVEILIKSDGAIILMLLMAGIAFAYVINRALLGMPGRGTMQSWYAIQFVVAIIIAIVMMFGDFPEYEHNPIRLARLPLLMGTILGGMVFYDFMMEYFPKATDERSRLSMRAMLAVFLGVAIAIMAILSVGSVYLSSWTNSPSAQVTGAEVVGAKWFETTKNPDVLVVASTEDMLGRFEHYNFGVDTANIEAAVLADPPRVPSHFGYDEYVYVAEALDDEDRYIVMSDFGKLKPLCYPVNVRPKIEQWTECDFAKLEYDYTVEQLYSSRDFEVWRVYGKQG